MLRVHEDKGFPRPRLLKTTYDKENFTQLLISNKIFFLSSLQRPFAEKNATDCISNLLKWTKEEREATPTRNRSKGRVVGLGSVCLSFQVEPQQQEVQACDVDTHKKYSICSYRAQQFFTGMAVSHFFLKLSLKNCDWAGVSEGRRWSCRRDYVWRGSHWTSLAGVVYKRWVPYLFLW